MNHARPKLLERAASGSSGAPRHRGIARDGPAARRLCPRHIGAIAIARTRRARGHRRSAGSRAAGLDPGPGAGAAAAGYRDTQSAPRLTGHDRAQTAQQNAWGFPGAPSCRAYPKARCHRACAKRRASWRGQAAYPCGARRPAHGEPRRRPRVLRARCRGDRFPGLGLPAL